MYYNLLTGKYMEMRLCDTVDIIYQQTFVHIYYGLRRGDNSAAFVRVKKTTWQSGQGVNFTFLK